MTSGEKKYIYSIDNDFYYNFNNLCMIYKNANAEKTTVTRDVNNLEDKTGNLYQSIVAISKRSNQISTHIKEELNQKLQVNNKQGDLGGFDFDF